MKSQNEQAQVYPLWFHCFYCEEWFKSQNERDKHHRKNHEQEQAESEEEHRSERQAEKDAGII